MYEYVVNRNGTGDHQCRAEFVNLPQIESVDQVLRIFMPVAEGTQSPLFQTIRDRDVGAFVDDRAQLLEWLDTIGRRRHTKADRENI
jgi:hypothetical protein